MFCAVAAGFALIASGLVTGCAAGAVRPSLSGRTAQSAIICCVSAVAVTSVRNAWAVGGGLRTVILHWNGTAWKRAPSPGIAGSLSSVAAISGGDAWAVGDTSTQPGRGAPLILHWNGKAWKRVPSPNRGAGTVLDGVAATSAGDAWAVGYAGMGPRTCRRCTTLILHWNGKAWRRVPSPNPSIGSVLYAVTATSAGNAWAVGYTPSLARSTLILHWNGKAWTRVPSPNPPGGGTLTGVAATSARSAWAVGYQPGRRHLDPALERQGLEAGAQPEPHSRHPRGRSRRLRPQRLGGRQHWRPHLDPALDRHRVGTGAQPESHPGPRREPHWRRGHICQERVGGRLRRWWRAGPDRALERRLLDDVTGHVYLADSIHGRGRDRGSGGTVLLIIRRS